MCGGAARFEAPLPRFLISSVVCGWLARIGRSSAHVGNEEDNAEGDAEGSNDDVANGEEVVGTAKNVSRREHEILASIERTDIVRVADG